MSLHTHSVLYVNVLTQMVKIAPGIYIYPEQDTEVRAQKSGEAMVRVMLRHLFTKEELRNGTLSTKGASQFSPLNATLVKAILGTILIRPK